MRILRQNRGELRLRSERLQSLERRLERLENLKVATVAGLNDLRSRFDSLLELAVDRYRDHEQRIRTLEQQALREQ